MSNEITPLTIAKTLAQKITEQTAGKSENLGDTPSAPLNWQAASSESELQEVDFEGQEPSSQEKLQTETYELEFEMAGIYKSDNKADKARVAEIQARLKEISEEISKLPGGSNYAEPQLNDNFDNDNDSDDYMEPKLNNSSNDNDDSDSV